MAGKQYKHIFFDLDHTLWDFEKCSSETLLELYLKYEMKESCGFSSDSFINGFSRVNVSLWDSYNQGKISKEELRKQRFIRVFEHLKYENKELIACLEEDYIVSCSSKGHLIPHSFSILEYLSQKYELHIITNGFEDVQQRKLESSKIAPFFREIITSERAGFRKPEKGIFEYALNTVCCSNKNCIMIGDSLEADILGSSNAAIDNIFFNPTKMRYTMSVTHEVGCLSEIKRIL